MILFLLAACSPDDLVGTKGDADGDGVVVMQDCDDADPNVGAASLTAYGDGDGDGYGRFPSELCAPEEGFVAQGGDCNDEDPTISPAASEVCDDVDQNCDGNADADLGDPWYPDADEDGFGQQDGTPTIACNQPRGYVASTTDCDDSNYHVSPGADELCDGVDQNCNGLIDDDALDALAWYADMDGDGFGVYDSTLRSCTQPANGVANYADCDDEDSSINPDEPDVCDDGVDNDCDGTDAACGWSGSYDLGTDASAFARGDNNRDQLGDAVVGLGDVDGDGLDEVAVSSYQASLSAGKTWILSGADLSGSTSVGAIATASWQGAVEYTNAGRFLAGVGDVSGDGVPDLFLGSDRAGEVWVVSADRTGSHTVDEADTILSSDWLSLFGSAVAAAGDVDGDGYRDLLVSAPNTGQAAGTTYLFSGPLASGTLSPDDARSSFTGATSDYAGYVLDGGQDLDGDGLPDVVVGTLYGPASHGAVWVLTHPAAGETALSDADAELLGSTYTDHM
ncbi:MAG TPA: MopE-related protein, partial [Myxococcota bacterium]|nr:MopE-related protein [Myxococcota bacterium]